MKRLVLTALILFLGSCSEYRWDSTETQRAVAIPYVQGDQTGIFTAELVSACCNASGLSVTAHGTRRLEVSIVQDGTEPLGYRRDPQKINNEIHHHLTQNEERRSMTVDVVVIDTRNGRPIFGPLRLTDYVDYDYVDGDSLQDLLFKNGKGIEQEVLPFSLGQLSSEESARLACEMSLCRKLAQKIADFLEMGDGNKNI